MVSPIIVGGNGHSGTRLFAEILLACGVFMGFSGFSYDRNSKDLNIRSLMDYWMRSYLLGLDEKQARKMRRQFLIRLRILIPYQGGTWGFKNPRAMFLLPFYHQLFPDMKFIHVIRDGRDMCFGNPFIRSPTYWGLISEEEASSLSAEERMMRFWGEGNRNVKEYGDTKLGTRYLRIRFEDICDQPKDELRKIVDFIQPPKYELNHLVSLVKRPKSIGRWKEFPSHEVEHVVSVGQAYLKEFGYLASR